MSEINKKLTNKNMKIFNICSDICRVFGHIMIGILFTSTQRSICSVIRSSWVGSRWGNSCQVIRDHQRVGVAGWCICEGGWERFCSSTDGCTLIAGVGEPWGLNIHIPNSSGDNSSSDSGLLWLCIHIFFDYIHKQQRRSRRVEVKKPYCDWILSYICCLFCFIKSPVR